MLCKLGKNKVSVGQIVANWFSIFECLKVIVEEIAVKASLYGSRQKLCPAKEVVDLVAVNPIKSEGYWKLS